MYKYIIDTIEQDLMFHTDKLAEFEQRYSKLCIYENSFLIKNTSHGNVQFCVCHRENGKEYRQYITRKNYRIVLDLQEYKFLKHSIKTCRANINAMKKFLSKYQDISPYAIERDLPKAYQNIELANDLIYGASNTKEWLRDMNEIKSKHPIFKPENLKHRAADGSLRRSKVECIISDILSNLSIPYVYELPIYIDGELFIPDFVCLDIETGELVIIEFFGMMSNPSYSDAAFIKMSKYTQAGYIINKNFIPLFDDLEGNTDTQMLKRIIEARFCR